MLDDQAGHLTRRQLLSRSATTLGGAVAAATLGSTAFAPAANAATQQANWWWCHYCHGLWSTSGGNACFGSPSGRHSNSGSNQYILTFATTSSSTVQANWRWCRNCSLLHWGTGGYCPTGGPHSTQGSGDYGLVMVRDRLPSGNWQDAWYYCHGCRGLWWYSISDFGSPYWFGACPAPANRIAPHIGAHTYGSTDYCLQGQAKF